MLTKVKVIAGIAKYYLVKSLIIKFIYTEWSFIRIIYCMPRR